MPTNLPLPAYSNVLPTAGACPIGYLGLPHAGPFTDCRINKGWHDYDFLWAPGGRLIVAACPTAADGDYGQLWVAAYDSEYPPNYVSHVVIETAKVWGCTLVQRPDGILDLWYLKSNAQSQPQHRFSRDGGATWSSAEIHTGGIFDFDGTVGITPVLTGASHSFHPLPACLIPGGQLTMLMDGEYTVGGTTYRAGSYLLVAKLAAGGERWEFTGKQLLAGYDAAGVATRLFPSSGIGRMNHLQAMPDGSVFISPDAGHLKSIKEDATCIVESWSNPAAQGALVSLYTNAGPKAGKNPRLEADWRTGRLVSFATSTVAAGTVTHHHRKYWGWGQSEFSSASRWADSGAAFYPPEVGGVTVPATSDAAYELGIRGQGPSAYHDDGTDLFDDDIPLCKQRPDGRWEMLRADHLGDLAFARCSVMPNDNVTTWDGR